MTVIYLVKKFGNFCKALRNVVKIHIYFLLERLISVSFSNRSNQLAGSFEDSSIQVWNLYPKIHTVDNSVEGVFVALMAHRLPKIRFVLWSNQSLNVQLKWLDSRYRVKYRMITKNLLNFLSNFFNSRNWLWRVWKAPCHVWFS